MRQRPRTGPSALAFALGFGLALASIPAAEARQAPTGGGAPAATAPKPPNPAVLAQVLATVNGQPITRGEVLDYLSQFPAIPKADEKEVYERAIELIANTKMLLQFFTKNRIAVTEKDYNDGIDAYARRMKAEENRDLKTVLAEQGRDINWLKGQMAPTLAFKNYIDAVGTDAALRKFAEDNKDIFSRSQVRASHILLLVPKGATPADKAAIQKRLLGIKADVEAGKISFADAANKFSEDDGNKTSPNGGDLGYFYRKGQYIEEISAKAFAMTPQTVSDPVETEFGLHLIQVTDRKPGPPFDFEQGRNAVLNQFRGEMQERIINQEKKAAKIEIKPMPADLFPPAPAAQPAGGVPGAGAPAPKAATPR